MSTMTAKPRKVNRGARSNLSPNFSADIDQELVCRLISKHFSKLNPPSFADAVRLSVELQVLRARIKIDRELNREAHRRLFEAQEAMTKLQEVIPHIAKPYRDTIEIFEQSTESDELGPWVSKNRNALALLESLLSNIDLIRGSPDLLFSQRIAPASKISFQDNWHHVVLDAHRAYSQALCANNPHAQFKVHGEGPGGNFLSEVLEYVTGEKIKPSTVQKKVAELLEGKR